MKLTSRGELYSRLASDALLEREFERLVEQESHLLFPRYELLLFRRTVESEYGRGKADYALIHKEYKEWWVVEVELAHHSLQRHVIPQVQILATARFGPEEAQHLAGQSGSLNQARLAEMMLGAQPKVLVVVNEDREEWREALARFDVRLLVAEVFRSTFDRHALLIRDALPDVSASLVSVCVADATLSRFLVVQSPAALAVRNGEVMEIERDQGLARWRRMDVKDIVWIYPESGDGFSRGAVIELHKADSGRLFFVERRRQTTRGIL